jgi:bifunctional non-homologous end joining protein LigD
LAFKDGKDECLVWRNKKPFDYPQLLAALKSLPADHVIPRRRNCRAGRERPLFVPVAQIFRSSGDVPLVYFALDLLFLEGKDLRNEPLTTRRKRLAQVLKNPPENIRLSDELRGTKDELLRVAQEFDLEGLVTKRPNSLYESGRRSGICVKIKITKSQEFVIGGYTLPEGNRKYFGSLLVGYHTPDGLSFAGRVHWFFGQGAAESLREVSKTPGTLLSVCKFVGENTRQMGGVWAYAGGHGTVAIGSNPCWLPRVNFTEWTHDDR